MKHKNQTHNLLKFAAIVLSTILIITMIARSNAMPHGEDLMNTKPDTAYPTALLGGGCFWCLESEFRALDGVLYTRVGYIGGDLKDPSYQDITTGKTGHAEAVEITYDPAKISYSNLLIFFLTKAHDPTQLNRQGVDIGTQYRSAIFYETDEQKEIAETVLDDLAAQKAFKNPIVTTLEPATTFWEGEDYHQQYYEKYEQKTGQKHIRVIQKEKRKGK